MKPIPGRAQQPPEPKEWREWFQISYRWRTGRCTTQELIGGILEPRSGAAATSTPHHILLAGSTTIIASSEASGCPQIHYLQAAANQTLRCGSSSPHPQTFHITAIALDQSPPALSGLLRLAVFLSTGEFIIFAIHPSNPVATTRKFHHIQRRRNGQVVQAVYHHPLLISLSDTFVLNLYDLSSDTVRHSQTLSSVSTFPPSSMILSTQAPAPAPRSLVYKLVLTYAVPIYPLHLSLGVTELLISSHASSDSMSFTPLPNTAPLTVFSTRTARALDVPQGWIDQDKLRIMKEQWGRKLLRIQATQSDGKWVVLAPGEQVASTPSNAASGPQVTTIPTISGTSAASLQLYRLFLPAVTSIASPPPKLTFNRYLEHTAGTVSSMSLADGRCVTLGKNSVCIWDLESGTSAEVALPTSMRDEGQGGTIAFDDRRIITSVYCLFFFDGINPQSLAKQKSGFSRQNPQSISSQFALHNFLCRFCFRPSGD
uniref:WD40 repeat-like protein n=1 Tax=Mycena chlorophos TaxID=658473 RepID=A0ABQ0LYW1_MYCCL|nr:predicted protein [Mycena chlorophos]